MDQFDHHRPYAKQFFNADREVSAFMPILLWAAKPMASSTTGFRPRGESIKLFGAWWRVEAMTHKQVREEITMGDARGEITVFDQQFPFMSGFSSMSVSSLFHHPISVSSVPSLSGRGSMHVANMKRDEAKHKERRLIELSSAVRNAINAGISSETMHALIDSNIVVSVMSD